MRINDATRNTDGERGGAPVVAADLPANVNPMLRDKILAVRDGQTDVKGVLDKIHQQLVGPDRPASPAEQPK
jgi:hypothetical protein